MLKLVYVARSYSKDISGTLLWTTVYISCSNRYYAKTLSKTTEHCHVVNVVF